MSCGIVFNIQRFSIHDGPGIRTSVFMKGCPLQCEWCHNPESRLGQSELSFIAQKCVACERCAEVCPTGAHIITHTNNTNDISPAYIHTLDREKCIRCGKCADICCYGALSMAGKLYTADQVIGEALRDLPFYNNSGGGITFTGGEPFAQYEFLLGMLRRSKSEGLHICIESSLYTAKKRLLEAAEYVDLWLADFKESDDDLHKKFTGVSNKTIIDNFYALDAAGANIMLRCPLIPGRNTREDHYRQIAGFASSLSNIAEVDLIPYHPLGISKRENFGHEPSYDRNEFMEEVEAEKAADFIKTLTCKKVVVR